jgi:hypothetical protein
MRYSDHDPRTDPDSFMHDKPVARRLALDMTRNAYLSAVASTEPAYLITFASARRFLSAGSQTGSS